MSSPQDIPTPAQARLLDALERGLVMAPTHGSTEQACYAWGWVYYDHDYDAVEMWQLAVTRRGSEALERYIAAHGPYRGPLTFIDGGGV